MKSLDLITGASAPKKESLVDKINRICEEGNKPSAASAAGQFNPLSLFSSLGGMAYGANSSGSGEYITPPANAQEMIKTTVERFEGGLSDHKADRGGRTYKGITSSEYQKYRQQKGLPAQDVAKMSDAEMNEIYYNSYMVPSGAAALIEKDPKLAYALFDTAVLYGVGTAKRMLQESGGTVEGLLNARERRNYEIVNRNPSQSVFLKGWNNRVATLKKMLLTNREA